MTVKRIFTEKRIVLLLVFSGIFLRLLQLPFSCIWLDEAFSISLAEKPLVEIVRILSEDNGSPLFYFLLHGWIRIFGDGEYVLTLLAVLFDSAVVIAVPFFLREVFRDERIRITGTACAAFCLPCLHHVTNLRYYSLTLLCTVLAWLFLYRARRTDALRDRLLFVFVSIAGAFTHSIYIFVFIPQLLILLRSERKRNGLLSMLFVAAGALLWLPALMLQVSGYAAGGTPETVPQLTTYHGPIGAYLLSISSQMLALDSIKPLRMAVAAILWGLVGARLFCRTARTEDDRAARELFFAHFFSVGLMVLISIVRPLFWLDKTDLIGLPLVCALTGVALSRLKAAPVLIAGLILFNLLGAVHHTVWRVRSDLDGQRDAVTDVAAMITSADAVVMAGLSFHTVEYYFGQMGVRTGPRYVYPQVQQERPSCIDVEELMDNQQTLEREAVRLVERLRQVPGRVFIFYSDLPGLEPLYQNLEQSFKRMGSLPVRRHPWGPVYSRIDIYDR